MTVSGIRILDHIKAPGKHFREPRPEPCETFPQKLNMIFAKGRVGDILQGQRHKAQRGPARNKVNEHFKMMTIPLFPASRTRPVPAAERHFKKMSTMRAEDHLDGMKPVRDRRRSRPRPSFGDATGDAHFFLPRSFMESFSLAGPELRPYSPQRGQRRISARLPQQRHSTLKTGALFPQPGQTAFISSPPGQKGEGGRRRPRNSRRPPPLDKEKNDGRAEGPARKRPAQEG